MKPKSLQPLLLSLITDDLIHTKLITSLQSIGFEQDWYSLRLSETVLDLMGFKGQMAELVYEHYLDRRNAIEGIDISAGYDEVKALALSIYNEFIRLQP